MTAQKQNNLWSVGEAKTKFSEVLKLSKNEPQRVFSDGKPAGAVISDDDYALLISIKQDQTRSLLDELIKAAESEGLTDKDFENLKGPTKTLTIE